MYLSVIFVGGVGVIGSIERISDISRNFHYSYDIFSNVSLFGYLFDIGVVIRVRVFRGLDVVYLESLVKTFYYRYPCGITGGFKEILEGDEGDSSEDDKNGDNHYELDESEAETRDERSENRDWRKSRTCSSFLLVPLEGILEMTGYILVVRRDFHNRESKGAMA